MSSAPQPPVRSPFSMPPPRMVNVLLFKPPIFSRLTPVLKPYSFPPAPSRTPFRFAPIAMAANSSKVDVADDVDGAPDPLQVIRKHQDDAVRLPPVEEIRTLLYRSVRGVLSTFSKEHEGYPSGSMVDFACDHDGSPILSVSSLAVHSKNLLGNPKCSLLVAKDPEDRTDTVITLYGDAISVSESDSEAIRTAYLRRHPDAFWVDFGDFSFIQIEPKYVRYVSGVATALLGSGEFDAKEFKAAKVDPISQFSVPIASHMNKEHAEDTKAIVQYSTSVKVDYAYILDLDSLGLNVKAGYQGSNMKLRIPFPRRALDRNTTFQLRLIDDATLLSKVDFGDFSFIQIEPKYVRYVSGVATALLGSGEFDAKEFTAAKVDPISQFSVPIASHMNKDHAEDTKAIVQYFTSVKVDYAYIIDLDSLGLNVKAGYQGSNMKLRIPFPRRAQDRKDVKTLIVEMLQAAKAPSSS